MIACYYHRKIIRSSLDADSPLPDQTRNHIQKCPGCRKVYESETRIIRELLVAAGTVEQSPSSFLHARIMSSIARSETAAEGGLTRGRPVWAVGLATAFALLVGVLWIRQRTVPDQAMVARPPHPSPIPIELSLNVNIPDGSQLRQWTGKLDEPLETEMKLVVSDATTAFNSLANNFLPEEVRQSLSDQSNGRNVRDSSPRLLPR